MLVKLGRHGILRRTARTVVRLRPTSQRTVRTRDRTTALRRRQTAIQTKRHVVRPSLAVHRQMRLRTGMSHAQIRSRVLTSETAAQNQHRRHDLLPKSVNGEPNQLPVPLLISRVLSRSPGVSPRHKPAPNGTSRRGTNAPMKCVAKTQESPTTLANLDGRISRTTSRTRSRRHLRPTIIVRTKA